MLRPECWPGCQCLFPFERNSEAFAKRQSTHHQHWRQITLGENAFFHFSRQGYLITSSQTQPQRPACLSLLPMAPLVIPKGPRSQRATSLAAQGTLGSRLWSSSCSSAQITATRKHDPAAQLPSPPSNTAALAEEYGQQEEEQNQRQDILPWVAQPQNKLQDEAMLKQRVTASDLHGKRFETKVSHLGRKVWDMPTNLSFCDVLKLKCYKQNPLKPDI